MIQENFLLNSNEAGFRHAINQLESALRKPGWKISYDSESDTLFVRLSRMGPAISYHCPSEPNLLFRLDRKTNELTGIDFTAFKSVLISKYPGLKALLPRRSFLDWFGSRPVEHDTMVLAFAITNQMGCAHTVLTGKQE